MLVSVSNREIFSLYNAVIDVLSQMAVFPFFKHFGKTLPCAMSNLAVFQDEELSHENSFCGHGDFKSFLLPLNNNCNINYEVVLLSQPDFFSHVH